MTGYAREMLAVHCVGRRFIIWEDRVYFTRNRHYRRRGQRQGPGWVVRIRKHIIFERLSTVLGVGGRGNVVRSRIRLRLPPTLKGGSVWYVLYGQRFMIHGYGLHLQGVGVWGVILCSRPRRSVPWWLFWKECICNYFEDYTIDTMERIEASYAMIISGDLQFSIHSYHQLYVHKRDNSFSIL